MIKNLKTTFDNLQKKIKNFKFKKRVSREKKKLYIVGENKSSYKSTRNKFKVFKTKLQFENTFNEIKKINLYYYLIGIFLILASLYVVVFSHYFSVKSVDVIRNDELVNIDLAYKAIENIRLEPMVFVQKDDIKNFILSHQPNIQTIDIRKIYPSNIKITLSSYKDLYNVNIDGKFYRITENGVFIPNQEKPEGNIIKIIGLDNFGIIDYKKILDGDTIGKIKEIETLINSKNSFIKIKELAYYKKEKELHIIDDKNIRFIFDLTKEVSVQVEKLNIFYKEYLKKIKGNLLYIDLRINERVIYCTTESEFQCNSNIKNIYQEQK